MTPAKSLFRSLFGIKELGLLVALMIGWEAFQGSLVSWATLAVFGAWFTRVP